MAQPNKHRVKGGNLKGRKSKSKNPGSKKSPKPFDGKATKPNGPVNEEELAKITELLDQISKIPDYSTHEKFKTLRYYKLKLMNLDVEQLNQKFDFDVLFLLKIKTPLDELLDYFDLDKILEHAEFFNKTDGVITLLELHVAGVTAKELLDKDVPFEILYSLGRYNPKELRVGGINNKNLQAFLARETKKIRKPKPDKSEFKKQFYKPKHKKR